MIVSKYLIFIVVFILLSVCCLNSKNYAILMSGGFGGPDDEPEQSCYRNDIVISYIYLVEYAAYTHDEIMVFFSNGEKGSKLHAFFGEIECE